MSAKILKRDLDHQVWKLIKQYSLADKRILVALSGGVDSVVLLKVLTKIHKTSKLGAFYFHHGAATNLDYRNEAQLFCKKLCKKLDIEFFTEQAILPLKTEAECRQARYAAIEKVMRNNHFAILATGHHRDDLLETRILRLIRGTGLQGLSAMHFFKANIFRPLLAQGKEDLKKYLRDEKLKSCEDPSNDSLDPLRNWLRQEWLVALEKRQPGGKASLARSLETITSEWEGRERGSFENENEVNKTQGLSRAYYLTLPPQEQRRLLAHYLYTLGRRDFSQAHLEEIQKRLDNSQRVITFKVGGCRWEINAEQIKVQS